MDTPVVVARTDAIVEYFSDDMVEYFEPGDVDALATAIIRLGAEPTRRAALAQNAGRFNSSHSWTNSAAAYAENVSRLGAGNANGFRRRGETR